MVLQPDVSGLPDVHLTTLAWDVVRNRKNQPHVVLYRTEEVGDLPGRQTNTSDVLVQHSTNAAHPAAEPDVLAVAECK
jgi:hypothetical protein